MKSPVQIRILSAVTMLSAAFALPHCASKSDVESLSGELKEVESRLNKLEAARPSAPNMPPAPPSPDASKVYAVPVGSSAQLGNTDAWVTIIEISDFQCPFCSRGAATLKEVSQKYREDVRIVFKHNPLPFHPRAQPAAIAAQCAGEQKRFWPMADAMFAEQSKLGEDDFKTYAKGMGLDMAKFSKCLDDEAVLKGIAADAEVAAKFGARGTPAFFINGRFLSGAQPLANFVALIDEELKKAKASGIKQADYYAKAVEKKGEQSL